MGRGPGFTAVAVHSLALGIGANTAIFSVIDALLLKNLPVRSPEQLVTLGCAMSALTPTRFHYLRKTRSHECERCTHECVRHIFT